MMRAPLAVAAAPQLHDVLTELQDLRGCTMGWRIAASLHEVREFAGHADIRTTELYFVRKEEDAEVAARRIHIRVTGRTGA
jgi:hypothetical protein